ncbi:MAG: YhfZ family protein [Alphaproteobacteria bacterium]
MGSPYLMKDLLIKNNITFEQGVSRGYWVMQNTARILLDMEVGDSFARLTDLQDIFSVGAGTVQTAIKSLEDIDAISLKRSGHLGTQIAALDYAKLASIGGRSSLIGLFPSSSADEPREVSEKIQTMVQQSGFSLKVQNIPGAKKRIQPLLDDEADFAMVSIATIHYMKLSQEEFGWFDLGSYSFYKEGSLNIISRTNFSPENGSFRLGLDRESIDHELLGQTEFATYPNVKIVECHYIDSPKLILENQIDCSVWHNIDMIIPLSSVGIVERPFKNPQACEKLANVARGALVYKKSNRFAARIIQDCFKTKPKN